MVSFVDRFGQNGEDAMLTYQQATGEIRLDEHWEGIGYSGRDDGRNNTAMEAHPDVGPIPRGRYKIGPAHDHPKLGPIVFDLTPEPGTNVFTRSAFRIHGDNAAHDASHGCI